MDRTVKKTSLNVCAMALLSMGLCLPQTAAASNDANIAAQQARKIQGTVVDKTGEPIIGASVVVQGQSMGSVTDIDGNFTLAAEPGATIKVSYIGYLTKTIKASSSMQIVLEEDSKSLDEVVVVGYGVQKKKLLTGATTQMKGDAIAKLNTTSPLQAMQGQTPGVNIASESGQPGSDMKVVIRGLGTVGNSGPLYLIDGVGGDISTVNPADIESIDVLKDAASAAIYGAQAANGVVLVTTKHGKEGKAVISFDGYYGIQNVARKANMLNAQQYMEIMNEQALNSGNAAIDWSQYKTIKDGSNYIDSDWMGEMFKSNARTQSYNVSVSGGSRVSTYAVSFGYMDQEGIVGGKDVSNYKRYNFRANLDQELTSWLKIGEQLGVVYKNTHGVSVGNQYNNSLRGAFAASPLVPIYGANNYDVPYYDTSNSDWWQEQGNPYGSMMINNNNDNRAVTFTGNVYAEIEPLKNLKFRTQLGTVYSTSEYRGFSPYYQLSTYSFNTTMDSASQSMGHGLGMTWTNTLSYNFKLSDHNFNVLAGMESYRYEGTSLYAKNGYLKDGFNDWEHAYVSNGTGSSTDEGMSVSGAPNDKSRSVSYFGRIGWDWKERYMINATLRADGSSRFASGHRFGYFPSVSAGWTISNEKFMESAQSWLDFLKIRASWGQVGNQNIDNYQYLAPITSSNTHYNFGTGLGATAQSSNWGAYPSRLANENLTWETSEQTNIGFDARLINNHLGINFDYYWKTTKDWLVQAPIPATAGTGAPYINGGDVKNRGVEVAMTWDANIGKDFRYSIGANMAYNKNEVGNIPTEDGIIHGSTNMLYDNSDEFYRAENGHAIGYFWGYKTAGIFQNQQEIDDWVAAGNGVYQGSSVQPGDVKYVDVNHDGVIDESDKVDLGSGTPKYTFGFNISLYYKNFDFAVTASGAAGQKIVQTYRNHANTKANYTTEILQRWTGEGTSNWIPRVTETNVNWAFSDLYIHKGDYLRISNVTLGYDFSKMLKLNFISQARLYVQAQNLFTFTKYNGMDPEIGYGTSSWVSGIDVGYYPRPRTFLVGVNIKFGAENKKPAKDIDYNIGRKIEPEIVEKVVEKVVEKPVVKEVVKNETVQKVYVATFAVNSSDIEDANAELGDIPAGATVDIVAYASPEGNAEANKVLSQQRADSVANYLKSKGINVASAVAKGANNDHANRIAIVSIR